MIVICGKSNSGKDTIASQLELLGYTHITTDTTRAIREGEIPFYTYNYRDTKEFLTKLQDGDYLEFRWYDKSDEGIVFYSTSWDEIKKSTEKSYIILTPSGIKKLKENHIPITIFYIDASDDTIRLRQKLRGDATQEEMDRRFEADKHDFVNIESLYDFKINNENKTPMDLALEIDTLYNINNL